jgi:hypothetical protein
MVKMNIHMVKITCLMLCHFIEDSYATLWVRLDSPMRLF